MIATSTIAGKYRGTVMRSKFSLFLGASLILQTSTTLAQEVDQTVLMLARMSGTTNVVFNPQMIEGKLQGCILEFEALYQDWKYRAGIFLKIGGHVGILKSEKGLGATNKVVVHEMDISALPLQTKPSVPSRIYLMGANYNTNLDSLISAQESDTPGGLFAIFNVSPTLEIVIEALEKKRLIVAFNQFKGETDIQIPIELDVVSVDQQGIKARSTETISAFARCLGAL